MYSDFFTINKNFQSSINLEFDLNNEKKIEEYIPTTDICDVLKKYVNAVLGYSHDRSTILAGPYGKGKSFLLLVLTYILGKKKDETYRNFLRKVKAIDPELSERIKEIDKKKIRLLPIIINSNYSDLNQAFMLALNDALNREKLTDIVPQTVYEVCINLIDKWEKEPKQQKAIIKECQKKYGINLSSLRRELLDFSPSAYEKFKEIYNCTTSGLEFNPLINNDIVKIYQDVSHELTSHGFSGMFIVFDEFSKFIENSDDTLMRELKIVQDLAELASRSSASEQIHFCCVTHKSLSLYSSGTSKEDAIKTVEGRFKEIKFNRSMEENYQIISAAIRKDTDGKSLIENFLERNSAFYTELENSQPFENLADHDVLFKGCFPLNPFTVYSLIQLSEHVAQNERTLFTFLSDTDDNSFASFIRTNSDGLFNVDKIYDYFSQQLQRDTDESIRGTWYRAEGTLSKISDPDSRRIIKTLAVILMIDDPDRFAANAENLHLGTMIPLEVVSSKLQTLLDDRYIRINPINKLITLATSNNKEIEEQIQVYRLTKGNSLPIESLASEVDETKYVLPRRYNETHKIIRYFRIAYLTEKQFFSMNSFELLHEQYGGDGLVINLIRKEADPKKIFEKVKNIGDPLSIVRFPDKTIDTLFDNELIRYGALKDLLLQDVNDSVIHREISLLFEETKEDIQALIEKYFDKECQFFCYGVESNDFVHALSEIMEKVYFKSIIFNNELVNKDNVTTQYQKSINNVIDWMLSGSDKWNYSDTSPETTIRNSVVLKIDNQPDVREVVDGIKEKIIHSENNLVSVSDIVDQYRGGNYGIRRGIIPLLIGKAISELSDNVILYLQKNEIELNAANIVKAVNSSSKYFFGFSKGSKEQTEYLYDMLKAFGVTTKNNFRSDTKILSDEYRKFFLGLPMILRTLSPNNSIGVSEEILKFQNVFLTFNINPYESVYVKPFECLHTNSYKEISKRLIDFVKGWQSYVDSFKDGVITKVKQEFSIPDTTSLRMGIEMFINHELNGEKPVLTDINNRIMSALKNLDYNDQKAIDDISYAGIGSYIEDWDSDRTEELIKVMRSFIDALRISNKVDTANTSMNQIFKDTGKVEFSDIGKLLEDNIKNVIDEFGDSVSAEEKLAIFANMIKKYL